MTDRAAVPAGVPATLEDAVAWADRTRSFRAAFLARCASLDLDSVRSELEREREVLPGPEVDRLAELRLLPVLEAIPSIGGKVASRRLLASVALPEDVLLGDVGTAAWDALLGAVAA